MRRSRGYGWRLLTLHGAGRFLIVAGNEATKPSYRSLAPLYARRLPTLNRVVDPVVLGLQRARQAHQRRR